MGRPRKEPTRHIRVPVSLWKGLRNEFPSIRTDGDRVATCFDYYRKVQGTIDNVGGFIYGKGWKRSTKK